MNSEGETIVITPEMLQAGIERLWALGDVTIANEAKMAYAIFTAMVSASSLLREYRVLDATERVCK